MVKRGVTRILTPGTVTDEACLMRGDNLLGLHSGAYLAVADVSTGRFEIHPCASEETPAVARRLGVQELLLPIAPMKIRTSLRCDFWVSIREQFRRGPAGG